MVHGWSDGAPKFFLAGFLIALGPNMWFSQSGHTGGMWGREVFPYFDFFSFPLGKPLGEAVSPRPCGHVNLNT